MEILPTCEKKINDCRERWEYTHTGLNFETAQFPKI